MEASSESLLLTSLPKDIWTVLLRRFDIYDTIFLRATSSWLYKLSKELHPFPKHFVLDQNECMAYLIKNGFISCLYYVRQCLNFEWTEKQCTVASRSGRVDTLKFLREHGCPFNANTALLECTKGTCDLNMIKFLHESGVAWDQQDPTASRGLFDGGNYYDRDNTVQTAVENMAWHGHVDCLEYAVQHGCQPRQVYYTPSTACLDYLIAHEFDWHGGVGSKMLGMLGVPRPVKLSFCEEAARRGNFTIFKYAVEKGAPLQRSATFAAEEGHLEVLKYALERDPPSVWSTPTSAKTVECLQYLLAKYGTQLAQNQFANYSLWGGAAKASVEQLQLLVEYKVPLASNAMQSVLRDATHSAATFKFMLEHVAQLAFETDPYAECALRGNLEGLKLAFERNLPFIQRTRPRAEPVAQTIMSNAIHSHNLAVVKFLWDKFPNKEEFNLRPSIAQSSPEILEFLTEQGVHWTDKHLAAAAEAGKLSNVAYLTRWGCRWDDESPCASRDPMCVKYAHEHGCTKFADWVPYGLKLNIAGES